MASADNLLAQQANQTMQLMEAISRNTQQEFANRAAMQEQELKTGLIVMDTIAKDQDRKERLSIARQGMALQVKRFEADEERRKAELKLLPLKSKAEEMRLRSSINAQTDQVVSPFIAEEREQLKRFTLDNPERASEAANIYTSVISKIASNDQLDTDAAIAQAKKEISSWVSLNSNKEKAEKESAPSVIDLDEAALSSAGSAYQMFGGNPLEVARKYDPRVRSQIDAAVRISELTGEMPSKEVAQFMDDSQLNSVIQNVSSRKKISTLNSALEDANKTLESYRKMQESGLNMSEPIKSLTDRIGSYSGELTKLLSIGGDQAGGQVDAEIADAAERAMTLSSTADSVVNSSNQNFATRGITVAQGEIPSDEQLSRINARASSIKPYWIVDALGGRRMAEKFKSIADNEKLSIDSIKSVIDDASEIQVKSLFEDEELISFIKGSGMDKGVPNPYTGPTRSNLGEALNIMSNRESSQSDKKRALKVLKDSLPSIIMRYTNQ